MYTRHAHWTRTVFSSHQIHHCAHVQGAAVLRVFRVKRGLCSTRLEGASFIDTCADFWPQTMASTCMFGVFNLVSTAPLPRTRHVNLCACTTIGHSAQPSTCERFWKTTENTARSHCTPRWPPVRAWACVARPRHPSRRVTQLQPQMAAVNCSAMWVICRARSVKPPVLGSCIELQDERQRVKKKKKRQHGPPLAPMGRVRPQSTRRNPLTGLGTVVDWLTGLTGPRIGIRIRIRLDAHSSTYWSTHGYFPLV